MEIGILGIPIDLVSLDAAVKKIIHLIAKKGSPSYVATVNLDFLSNAYPFRSERNEELLTVLRQASLVTADGMPLIWLSRLLPGPSLKERVAGSDLFDPLMRELQAKSYSVFLLGGTNDVLEGTMNVLKKKYPKLKVVGHANPPISIDKEDIALLETINQATPDLLLINLGNPKQELWFQRVQEKLKVPVSIGVGGTFSFISGKILRAPLWMQKLGLEWLFRLFQEPKRLFRRYVIDGFKGLLFTLSLLPFALKRKEKNAYVSQTATPSLVPFRNDLLLSEYLGKPLILDFEGFKTIDTRGLGFLIRLFSQKNPPPLFGVNASSDLKQDLKTNRLWDLLKNSFFDCIEDIPHV